VEFGSKIADTGKELKTEKGKWKTLGALNVQPSIWESVATPGSTKNILEIIRRSWGKDTL